MQKSLSTLLLAFGAILMLTSCGSEPQDTHAGQPVTKRKAVFKQMMRTLEPMGMVARDRQDYDRQEFLAGARELKRLASLPWDYFTPDSNYPPTRAKPEIWLKPDEFLQARKNMELLADKLAKAAEGGSLEAIRPVVSEVEKACQECHRQFRSGN